VPPWHLRETTITKPDRLSDNPAFDFFVAGMAASHNKQD
jgi:hypothetical protein